MLSRPSSAAGDPATPGGLDAESRTLLGEPEPPPAIQDASDLRVANHWLQRERKRLQEYTGAQLAGIQREHQVLVQHTYLSEQNAILRAQKLTHKSIDAFVDSDAALAAALDDMDSRLDDLQVDFVEAIFTSHQSERLELRQAVQLALICRYYERIGDHAVNIGERVNFMITGWTPEYTGTARLDLRRRQADATPEY